LDTKRYFGEGEEVVFFLSVAGKQGQKRFTLGSMGLDFYTKGLGWLGLKEYFFFFKSTCCEEILETN